MAIITQDGNYTVKLYNRNGSVISDNYKLSQIIADLIASGYDCNALTLHQYSSYGYGSLMAFKVTETGLYYVGDNDLKSGLGSNATLFQKDNITFNQHFYIYTDGSPVDRGAISLSTQTINGVEYYYDYDGNVANEPIIYVDSSISLVVNYTGTPSGGAGSGYIGNVLVSNKKMVGYNVPTSSAEATKTESVNEASASPVSGKPKSGNGYVRIKYLSDGIIRFKNAIVFPHNDFTVIGKNQVEYTISQVSQMCAGKNNNTYYLQWSGTRYICLMFNEASGWDMKLASDAYAKGEEQEDWLYGMNGVSPLYPCELNGNYLGGSWSFNSVFIDNAYYIDYGDRGGTEEHPIIIVSNLANFDVYKDGVKVMVR